jgi:hypothetical protein
MFPFKFSFWRTSFWLFLHTLSQTPSRPYALLLLLSPSCQMTIDFISSTTRVNVFSMILKFCCKVAKTPFIFFFCVWLFSNSYWVSWNSWSNYILTTNLTLFLSHPYQWASKSKGSMCCSTWLFPTNIPLLRKVAKLFSHKIFSHPLPF